MFWGKDLCITSESKVSACNRADVFINLMKRVNNLFSGRKKVDFQWVRFTTVSAQFLFSNVLHWVRAGHTAGLPQQPCCAYFIVCSRGDRQHTDSSSKQSISSLLTMWQQCLLLKTSLFFSLRNTTRVQQLGPCILGHWHTFRFLTCLLKHFPVIVL